MAPFITIFTPTYNRAHLLKRLYDSLLQQTFKDFEWLIVDDGSDDDTELIISKFISEKLINICYYKQPNCGKHIAINKGANLAKGDFFFIVDSDDFLPENSLKFIFDYSNKIKNNPKICGIVGKRFIINNHIENINFHENSFISNLFDIRYIHHYRGDMAEVIKTSVMKKFPFPSFPREKFCTEALVWNRISEKYDCLFVDDFIYNCEYQEGGLTSKYWQLLLKNPQGSLLYFKELLQFPLSKVQEKETLKAYNNIAKVNGYSKLEIIKALGLIRFIKIYF